MTLRSEILPRQSGMTLTFRYASGLFSQVEFETDRLTDGGRKVKQKIDVLPEGNSCYLYT